MTSAHNTDDRLSAAIPAYGPAFHEGERRMQETVPGAAEHMAEIGSLVIRDYMPAQHREFFPLLPFIIIGAVDGNAQPIAAVLAGPPGFVHAPDERSLRIDALPDRADPLHAVLVAGARIGLLGIQPQTRRRNRANAEVLAVDERGFTVAIEQSFGNCPKYIQARAPHYDKARIAATADTAAQVRRFAALPVPARDALQRADTFFIATAHPEAGAKPTDASSHKPRAHGVDVSHRGGLPGFIHVDGDGNLLIPDYTGNRFFNTLGNLLLNPRAGLLVIDYNSGDLWQFAVRGGVVLDASTVAHFPGAERLLHFTVDQTLRRPRALPLAWGPATFSPILENLTRQAQKT